MTLQVPTKAEHKHGQAFSTLQVSPPTSPTLSVNTEPISQWHCQKWHHEAEILYEVMVQERVTFFNITFVATMPCLYRPVAAESHENYNPIGSYLDFRVESK